MIILEQAPRPEWIYAGWTPLLLVLLIGLIVAGLYLNMRKHIRRADENLAAKAAKEAESTKDDTA